MSTTAQISLATAVESIDRISIADVDRFRSEYVERSKPAIVVDLFKGQAIEQFTDLAIARRVLGNSRASIRRNYAEASCEMVRSLAAGRGLPKGAPTRAATLEDYFQLVERDPATRDQITECPTPELVINSLNMSPLGVRSIVAGYGKVGQPADGRAFSLMFVANRGGASDLHTDWDGRDVLLYQGFGRKRVTLFPPSSAPFLFPIRVFSTVRLAGMPEDVRTRFVRFAGGKEATLNPGEAVFMPALYWHHLEYVDLALSFNFRFGGITDPDALYVIVNAHHDHFVQNLLSGVRDPFRGQQYRSAIHELRSMLDKPYANARAKYAAISNKARSLYEELETGPLTGSSLAYLDSNDFLGGLLSGYYARRPGRGSSAIRKWKWLAGERIRWSVRCWGARIASSV